MGKYGKDYEAFEIFEQIQSEEGQKEAVSQPLSQRGITEVLSFEEAPYFEIEYDTDPVQGGEIVQGSGAVSLSGVAVGLGEGKNGKAADGGAQNPAESEKRKETEAQGTAQPVSERIEFREEDPVRELFNRMRDIAREDRYLSFRSSKFYDQRMQRENAKTFYKQGMFMKDFEDEYGKTIPYSSYFPSYQMMGYDQLRTFFTWRTRVRQGRVEHISLSYAYLYIYELLNNIGVNSPEEGLGQLLFFWEAFRVYDKSVDKYVPRWLKDYHIYYELPQTFLDFAEENGLEAYYPGLRDEEEGFDFYCAISKYDIRKSAFYGEGREDMVQRCFSFTLGRLCEALAAGGFAFESFLFQPARNMSVWVPFKGALFYPSVRQRDRKVVLSRKEVYVCSYNEWTCSAMITADSGRRLLGYMMKQMEAVLRGVTKFKYKLSANPDMLSPVMADELEEADICLETVITDAVKTFYKEETRTVVRVNPGTLEKIRQEAYAIQEKLTVPEEGILALGQTGAETDHGANGESFAHKGLDAQRDVPDTKTVTRNGEESAEEAAPKQAQFAGQNDIPVQDNARERNRFRQQDMRKAMMQDTMLSEISGTTLPEISGTMQTEFSEKTGTEISYPSPDFQVQAAEYNEKDTENDEWKALGEALTETERQALRIILDEKANLKRFADEQGIMLEVLAAGINEKASDRVGDGLLDNDFEVYEVYLEDVRKMLDGRLMIGCDIISAKGEQVNS